MSLLNADRKDEWSVGRTSWREWITVIVGLVAIVVVHNMFDWFSWKKTVLSAAAIPLAIYLVKWWMEHQLDEEAKPERDPYFEP